jgi:hypothetical protein
MGCEGGAWAGTCDCWGGGAARAGGGAALMGGAEALGGEAALPLRGILNCVAAKMSQMKKNKTKLSRFIPEAYLFTEVEPIQLHG